MTRVNQLVIHAKHEYVVEKPLHETAKFRQAFAIDMAVLADF